MRNGEFELPLLAQIYDAENIWGRDDDYVLEFVDRVPHSRVADVGCGTGRVTVAIANAGHEVTGIDPAAASLERAADRPGGSTVRWITGTAVDLPAAAFDCVIMTAHVAQFFVTDDDWSRSMAAVHHALVPGGRLYFDSRDPAAKAWELWSPIDSRRSLVVDGRDCAIWTEVTSVREPDTTVDFTHHYEFEGEEELTSEMTLRFRDESSIRDSLEQIGFEIERIFGGWSHEPVGAGEFIVEARRR